MNEGWKCPVCSRGVAPGEKTCSHGGETSPLMRDYDDLLRRLADAPRIGPATAPPPYDVGAPWYPPYKVTSVSGTVSARYDPTLRVWN